MNNKYKITMRHPLLRLGLEIETEASEKYAVKVTKKLIAVARELNKGEHAV